MYNKTYAKNYYLKNKEEIHRKHLAQNAKDPEGFKKYHKDHHKNWYQKNKDKRQAQIKEYAKNHKEDSVKRTQKYVSKNKEKVYKYGVEYNQTIEGQYRTLLTRAKKWGSPYLTLEDFKEIKVQPCVYCGEENKRRGVDRIDNKNGYTKENSAPCCPLCNFMKKARPVAEFIGHAKKVSLHNP